MEQQISGLKEERAGYYEKTDAISTELQKAYVVQNTAKMNADQSSARIRSFRQQFDNLRNEAAKLDAQITEIMDNQESINIELDTSCLLYTSHLGLKECHIIGQSWGGMMQIAYAIERGAEGVKSFIISSGHPSSSLWAREGMRRIKMMSEEDQAAINDALERNDFTGEAYLLSLIHIQMCIRDRVHIVENTEEHLDYDMILRKAGEHRLKSASSALANATVTTANNLRAKCIVTPTVSGATARVVSKFKPKTGIIGISPDEATLRRMQINWGVMPLKSVAVYTTEDICDTCLLYTSQS